MTADPLAADRTRTVSGVDASGVQARVDAFGTLEIGDGRTNNSFNRVLISYWAPHAVHPADAAEASVTRGVA